MPKYEFQGKLPNGRMVRGVVTATSIDQANYKLKRQGVAVLDLTVKEGGAASGGILSSGGRISAKDIMIFTRQFAVMQEAGMGLIDTFEILSRQARTQKLSDMTTKLKNTIKEGASLGDAMALFPKQFNELYVSMVRAGEMSGALSEVFNKLAGYLEKSSKLMGQLKTAMVYPSIVLTVAFGIIWGLLVFVVPIFQKVFEGSKTGLPVPTQILVNLSHFVRENIVLTIGGIVGSIILLRMFVQTPAGKYKFHYALLKLPLIGNIVHKVAISRFTTTLSSLLSSGVSIVDALALSAKACGNHVVTNAVDAAAKDISEGKPLAFSLERTNMFPPMVVNMVRVGEETGSLDKMLNRVNIFFEDEVDESIKALTAAIEPLMIVGLGSIVAGFVIAMYLPVFQMATAMQ